MNQPLLEPPTDFTPFDLAEWIEISMLLAGESRVSAAEIESWFPQNQRPDAAEMDGLFAQIRERASIAPCIYPFRAVDEEIIVDEEVDPTIYGFLRPVGGACAISEGQPLQRNQSLARTSSHVRPCCGFLGQAPRRAASGGRADGRPEYLAEAVEWLAGEMGLEVGAVREDVDDDDKDGGVDVVAWYPFADGWTLFPTFLVQVTTEATYERKPKDVVPEQWVSWIRFGRLPQVGLSVPFAISNDAKVPTLETALLGWGPC